MLEKCCFSLELRTGTIVIACFAIVLGIFSAVGSFLQLGDLKYAPIDITIFYYLLAAASIIYLVSSCALLYGAFKEIAWLCLPYLGIVIFYTVLLLARMIRMSLLIVEALGIVDAVIQTAFTVYFWLVVYSFYQSIS